MALSKEEIATIKSGVNKAKKKAMAFGFAKTRKDGAKEPLLEIELKESMVKKAIKAQGAPPLMWGSLEMIVKQTMAFVVDKGKPKEIQQAIVKTLKKAHPLLGKARVLTRSDFDAEKSEAGGGSTGTPKTFEAKIITCWEPDGKSWEMILTGGKKQGIEKKMPAVVDYLNQTCTGQVIDVYPTRCKIRVEAPEVGDKDFPEKDFERIVLGAGARGKYSAPAPPGGNKKKVIRASKAELVSVNAPRGNSWTMILNRGSAHGVVEKTPVVINYGTDNPQSVTGRVIDVYGVRCKAKVGLPMLGSHETFSKDMVESIVVGSSAKGKYPSPAQVKQQLEKARADREAEEAAEAKKLEQELAKADPQHAKFESLMASYRGIEEGNTRATKKWVRKLQAFVKGRKVPRPRGYGASEVVLENLESERKFVLRVFRRSQDNPHDDEDYAEYLSALARAGNALQVYDRFITRARKHMEKFESR